MADQISDLLRLPDGRVDLAGHDPRATPGFPSKKAKQEQPALMAELATELDGLQERLFAAGRAQPRTAPSVLVILQGMDTSGKGGVIRHAAGLMDPQGVAIKGFKAPTKQELTHDFLWRIRREVPEPGMIGIFDRSQYEDVLVVRVDRLVPKREWETRFERINDFETELAESGTKIIKCFLNVSYTEQGERLMERLDRPDKYWKYNPGDLQVRAKWDQYQLAYTDVLRRCNTEVAPWYVIPSDRKWYRNWAVAQLLTEQLRSLNLGWPPADFDVAEQRRALLQTM
ncbi:PPK2 family polyphosphate kinase [Naumannella halotolerans]|uniref:PPK2 family polyphosphate kinase n=1 Tax=Naumannella halotolerans TaxID=993414 RepID=UPI00370D2995